MPRKKDVVVIVGDKVVRLSSFVWEQILFDMAGQMEEDYYDWAKSLGITNANIKKVYDGYSALREISEE